MSTTPEPDTRERAAELRAIAAAFRELATTELTDQDINELGAALFEITSKHDFPPPTANVRDLPTRPGPNASSRRTQLSMEAAAANFEQEAAAIDRRLDQADRPETRK